MTGRALLQAIALLVAFSPVVTELASHLRDESWARYALVFVPLLLIALRSAPDVQPRRDGLLLLALALAIELFCLAGNTTRIARPAFALALVGMCRAFGSAPTRSSLLAFWLVPVPWVALKLASPGLERFWLDASAAIVNALGASVEVDRGVVSAAAGSLTLRASDSGVLLCVLLAGLGWYAALRTHASLARCAGRAALWAAAGLPAQACGTFVAVGALAVGLPEVGRSVLNPLLWMSLAGLGVWRAESLARRAASPPGNAEPAPSAA